MQLFILPMLLGLLTLCVSVLGQQFTKTAIFMPGVANDSYVTALSSGGLNDETTIWGVASNEGALRSPDLTVTLGPNSMIYSFTENSTSMTDALNTQVYTAVTSTANCSYSLIVGKTRTARCNGCAQMRGSGFLVNRCQYTDLPNLLPEPLTRGYDGYVNVYVEATTTASDAAEAEITTSTQPGGAPAPEVTKWVQAVIAVAAVAAMAV